MDLMNQTSLVPKGSWQFLAHKLGTLQIMNLYYMNPIFLVCGSPGSEADAFHTTCSFKLGVSRTEVETFCMQSRCSPTKPSPCPSYNSMAVILPGLGFDSSVIWSTTLPVQGPDTEICSFSFYLQNQSFHLSMMHPNRPQKLAISLQPQTISWWLHHPGRWKIFWELAKAFKSLHGCVCCSVIHMFLQLLRKSKMQGKASIHCHSKENGTEITEPFPNSQTLKKILPWC